MFVVGPVAFLKLRARCGGDGDNGGVYLGLGVGLPSSACTGRIIDDVVESAERDLLAQQHDRKERMVHRWVMTVAGVCRVPAGRSIVGRTRNQVRFLVVTMTTFRLKA